MNLYIKKIAIQKNEKNTGSLNFNKGLSVVRGSAELYDVIRLILGKRETSHTLHNIRFFAEVQIDKTYYISGSKNKGELLFDVSVYSNDIECTEEYFELVFQNEEMDSALFFHRFKRQDFPHKLFKYRDLFKYYPDMDFATLTNGYGTTRSFRSFITDYIKNFKPIRLRDNKEIFLKLLDNGEFIAGRLNDTEKVCLSESENIIYHYLSFISIADFWSKAEKIRDFNRVNKPLIISNFLELLAEDINLAEIIQHANKIDRQVIMFSEKELKSTMLLNSGKVTVV